MKHLLTIAAFALCTIAPAAAQDLAANRLVVHSADLDLTTATGRTMLEARVSLAIAQVCPAADSRDLITRHYEQLCRATAWDSANQQLAQLYATRQVAEAVPQK
jgi:UrcA family protein